MEYAVILAAVLIISPFVLKIASSQDKKTKQNLRIIYLILLAFQILLGLLNWETLTGQGRSGFELAISYPNSYLWLFFVVTFIQIILLLLKKHSLDTSAVILNFANTIIFFITMISISKILGQQIVSLANIGTIFTVLTGNVVGLVLVNIDKNLLKKYF